MSLASRRVIYSGTMRTSLHPGPSSMNSVRDNKVRRWLIFRSLAPYYGKLVSATFIQNTRKIIPHIDRIHNLIEGIYKPSYSDYALSIASMLKNPYADKLHEIPDGTWWMNYSPKAGGMDKAQNVGLLNCMRDHEPIIVLKQITDKTGACGTKYRLMGLALVQEYDAISKLFTLHGIDLKTLEMVCAELPAEQILATALRSEIITAFVPFMEEDKAIYKTNREKRDIAFREVVLDEYLNTCAVTQTRFRSKHHVEAQASHIISKSKQGSDDPRNGIALSRSAHWAFDRGIFRISDQYEIVVNPKARVLDNNSFPILEMHGKKINLPDDSAFYPHQTALEWHAKEVFDKFEP